MKESMIENNPLFADLTDDQRVLIAERMVLETRRAGDVIYTQGRPASALYMIKSGRVRLVTEQFAVLANLSQGSLLGEADVLSGRSYTTTAEAATDVTLWALRADDLAELMAARPEIGRQLKVAAGISEDQFAERHLRRLALLNGLTHEQIREVARHLRPERFSAGQTVYRQGMPGDALYLIEEGQLAIQRHLGGGAAPETMASLGAGEFFGETSLLTGEPHTTDVVALTDVTTWALGRDDFETLVLRFPSLALNLSRVLSQRLRQSSSRPATQVQVTPAALPAAPSARPTAAGDVTGAMVGLNRAASNVTSWFGACSVGAKLRLAAVILLLIWLLGVAAPSAVISLLSSTDTGRVASSVAGLGLRDRVVRVAMAADLPVQTTPTYTPWPTETPIPTPTFTPTATPTNTPTPTPTFTPTATATPTNTPIPPTATPVPVRAATKEAPAVAAAAAQPPAPSVQYKLLEMRRMTPCENRGNHHIFIKVVDAAGSPVDGVTLVQVPNGQPGNVLDKMVSGEKGPGLAEFIMWKGAEYGVYVTNDGVNPASSDIAQPMHPNFTDEAMCGDGGGGGNTLFHNSFSVVFQKTF